MTKAEQKQRQKNAGILVVLLIGVMALYMLFDPSLFGMISKETQNTIQNIAFMAVAAAFIIVSFLVLPVISAAIVSTVLVGMVAAGWFINSRDDGPE